MQSGDHEQAVAAFLEARQALQAQAHVLPAHDQQKYEAELAEAQQSLHAAQPAPFHFARRAPPATAPAFAARPVAPAPSALPPSQTTVADVQHEVVRLPPTSRAVHLHRLHACVVHLGDVQGSVLLDACTCCVVLGAAWQCRVSHSHRVALGIEARSTLTLDASNDIGVSALAAWAGSADAQPPAVQDMDDVFGTGGHWYHLTPAQIDVLQTHLSDPKTLGVHLAT